MEVASVDDQMKTLTAGSAEVIRESELRERLTSGKPLRVKLGIDPTSSDIHLGFAVVLRKLRQFQDLGHRAVLIIGDFTARVGDPSGRSKTRPPLSKQAVKKYAQTYLEQVKRVLRFDGDLIEIRHNSEWLEVMDMEGVLDWTSKTTVGQLLQREDFAKRYQEGSPIALMELLYPILQGIDSVEVKADVELGGSDQLFNIHMGRELQKSAGQKPQVVFTMPLLEGLDGEKKMSKSLDNYIGIAEPPDEQFGKLMKIPDELLEKYVILTSGWRPEQADVVLRDLKTGKVTAVEVKRNLGRSVVGLYHGNPAAQEAEAAFDRVFKEGQQPREIPSVELDLSITKGGTVLVARAVAAAGLAASSSEARRLIAQRGVRIDGDQVTDPNAAVPVSELDNAVIQVGRRRWARISFNHE